MKPRTSPEKHSEKEIRHILVIRLSAMGDVAMLVPVLRVLTASYPHLRITVLTRSFFSALFKDLENVEVYKADIKGIHSGLIGLSRLAKELRDHGVDAVADVHNVLRSNILRSVFYFYGIPVRQIDKGRAEKSRLTAASGKILKPLKSTHQRYADVFAALGFPVDLEEHRFPPKHTLSPNTRQLTGKNLLKWVGIAPFAQHVSKVYPPALMEEVIRELNASGKLKIFLFGGGEEEAAVLEGIASRYPGVISLPGKLQFQEELDLISNLDAMVSMDSGNAHLAAMFGIPVISLWGVTHPYAGFKAFKQPLENCLLPDPEKFPLIPTSVYGDKYPGGYEDAIRSIPPASVVKKVQQVLEI